MTVRAVSSGESKTPGVSDSTDTTNPPDDGLGDFIPPAVALARLDDGLDDRKTRRRTRHRSSSPTNGPQ
jgi:hypothetical protein